MPPALAPQVRETPGYGAIGWGTLKRANHGARKLVGAGQVSSEVHIARIEATLGVAFRETTLGKRRVLTSDLHDVELDRIRALCVETERDIGTLLVGLSDSDTRHRVYLLPDVRSVAAAEIFRVGTHNGDDARCGRVRDTLARIHREAPFSAYFADPAGYKAQFAKRPSLESAERFAAEILDVDIEALELVDDPEQIITRMHEEGIFELWWD